MDNIATKLSTGDLQVAYNVNLSLTVVVDGDGLDYTVYYIQDGKLIKTVEMGLTSSIGYYSAYDISQQFSHLAKEFLLPNKVNK